jgi:2-keto-4-pentenoate hydratase/2-oxohepta-3-ene-1,7-dioic acid hydratase in catechol pathway
MKFLSYKTGEKTSFGMVTSAGIVDAGKIFAGKFTDLKAVIEAAALDEVAAACINQPADLGEDDIEFIPVVPNPNKILCIGLNYETHRKETGRDKTSHPAIFTRFADSQIGHKQPILMPKVSTRLDYEGELAVFIGKGGRYIDKSDAMNHIAGYSCYNDATVRDWQRHTIQFTPGKNFPSTGAIGPYLVTPDEAGDVNSLNIQTRLNGEVMQDSNTNRLIFDIPDLIEYLSGFTELAPGDIIVTGTPGGVGDKREPPVYMKPGDEVIVEIENVGLLLNTIHEEQ